MPEPRVFKTEDDLSKAMNELPDAPPDDVILDGAKLDEWQKKQAEEVEALLNAKIDPDFNPDAAPATGKVDPVGGTVHDTPIEPDEISLLKNRIDTQDRERQQLNQEFQEKLDRQNAEWEKKLKEMQEAATPPKEETPPPDSTLQSLENDLAIINKTLNDTDDKLENDRYLVNLNKKQDLIRAISEQKIKTRDALLAQAQKKLAEMEKNSLTAAEQKKKDDEAAAARAEQEKKNATVLKEIEEFRKMPGNEDFKSDEDYTAMYEANEKFYDEVAKSYWANKSGAITKADRDMAVAKYRSNPAFFTEDLNRRGAVEPKTSKLYDLLTEITYLKDGFKRNPVTGGYEEYLDSAGIRVNFPTMADARDHFYKNSGKTAVDLLKATQEGAAAALKAVQTRANPEEIDGAAAVGNDEVKLSDEQAQKEFEAYDEEKLVELIRSTKPTDPMPKLVIEFNKIAKQLGYTELDRDI